jgi:hypothetical protein
MEDTKDSDIKPTEDSSLVENQLSDEELEEANGGMVCSPIGGGWYICKE